MGRGRSDRQRLPFRVDDAAIREGQYLARARKLAAGVEPADDPARFLLISRAPFGDERTAQFFQDPAQALDSLVARHRRPALRRAVRLLDLGLVTAPSGRDIALAWEPKLPTGTEPALFGERDRGTRQRDVLEEVGSEYRDAGVRVWSRPTECARFLMVIGGYKMSREGLGLFHPSFPRIAQVALNYPAFVLNLGIDIGRFQVFDLDRTAYLVPLSRLRLSAVIDGRAVSAVGA